MTTITQQQALTTAERLLDTDKILTVVGDGGFLNGLAGSALLHARLATVDSVFAEAATRHWTVASRSTGHNRRNPGVFGSPGGLVASLIIGTQYLPDPTAHHESARHAAKWLSANVAKQAYLPSERRQDGDLTTPSRFYDTISGMAGTGRVLLAAVTAGYHECVPGLRAALDTLTAMISSIHGARPGWWLPTPANPTDEMRSSGTATTGLAHGIAGPLAFLATAHSNGWTIPGQPDAIHDAAQWLLHWSTNDTTRWPPYVSSEELDTGDPRPAVGRRDAWCYGTPGISRALTLAGHALSDTHLIRTATRAAETMSNRPVISWDTEGPALCHGHAGVLQSTATTSQQTAHLAATAATAAHSDHHRFGFQNPCPDAPQDQPGLLTGAAGVALALADHGNLPAPAVPTRWDALLLLS